VLVVGGYDANIGNETTRAELYDSVSGTWTVTGSMKEARSYHTATLLPNGKVLVAGGFNFTTNHRTQVKPTELYDPTTGRWTYTGLLNEHRESHGATLLPDGTVLVAGGSTNQGYLASAELYDPASGIWSLTGRMIVPRSEFTLTLLPNGQVLAAGGYTRDTISASAELYDPAAGVFTRTGQMINSHAQHTATLLTTGKVLVAGGYPDVQANAELYDPGDTD